eukprot:scaffold19557_cov76-Cyclotella_meneghiniana.AAC.4
MATAMSYKSPFALPPPSMRKSADLARVKLSNGSESGKMMNISCIYCTFSTPSHYFSIAEDQITSLNVLKQRDIMAKRGSLFGWCKANFLNFSSINMIAELRNNASRELESLGFPPSSAGGFHNRNEDSQRLTFNQAAICAGLYPNIAFRRSGEINFSTISNKKAKVHMSSVNAVKSQPLSNKCKVAENEIEFLLFGELVKGKTMFTMDHTSHLASPLPLILFCGELRINPSEDGKAILSVDDWLRFVCDPETASSLVILRQRIDSIFALMTSDPANYACAMTPQQNNVVETLDKLLDFAFMVYQKRR